MVDDIFKKTSQNFVANYQQTSYEMENLETEHTLGKTVWEKIIWKSPYTAQK
jgi:hypothetical protein